MKLKLDLSDEKFKESLKDNQELLIVISVFGIAILLFVVFILPSIINFPSKVNERNVEIEELNKIKQAKTLLESTDQNQLETDTDTVMKTLPSDRNYELVLGAISEAATRTNSIVTEYSYESSPNVTSVEKGEYPSLIFEIDLAGDIKQAALFTDQLAITYPISEVKEISYERGVSTITVSFYYKPFTEVNAQDVALAREKTEDEAKALEEISDWNLFIPDFGFIQEVSTESASPF